MQIKQLRISELLTFVKSEEFKNSEVLPITLKRAESQVKNPRAKSDDIVLTVAFNDAGKVIAYVGALPDLNKNKIPLAWNSCWYSDAKEGKTIALPLFLQFVKNFNSKVIFQDLTPHTSEIIKSLPYFEFVQQKKGVRLYLRSVLSLVLPQKRAFFKYFKWALFAFDFFYNLPGDLRWRLYVKRLKSNLSVESVNAVDDEAGRFIEQNNKNEFIRRGKDEINWIISNKWLIEKADLPKEQSIYLEKHYHFSSQAKVFKYHLLKIKKGNEMVGFTLLRQRDSSLDTSYIYFKSGYEFKLAEIILKKAVYLKIDIITTFNSKLSDVFQQMKMPVFYKRNLVRDIVTSKELLQEVRFVGEIQDGDGDVVFS